MVDNTMTAEPLVSFSNGVVEVLAVKIFQLNHVVVNIYRPPDTPWYKFKEALERVDDLLNSLETPCPDVSIQGDFNFSSRDVTWSLDECGDPVATVLPRQNTNSEEGVQTRRQAEALIKLVEDHNMQQVVDVNTRVNERLDLVFVNNEDLVFNTESEEVRCMSDHNLVTCYTSYNFDREDGDPSVNSNPTLGDKLRRLDFNKVVWADLSKKLAEKLGCSTPLSDLPVEQSLQLFYECLLAACEETVPAKRKPSGSGSNRKNNMSPKRRSMFKRLCKLRKRLAGETKADKITALLRDINVLQQSLLEDFDSREREEEAKASPRRR